MAWAIITAPAWLPLAVMVVAGTADFLWGRQL